MKILDMAIIYLTTNLINQKKYIGADKNNNPKYLGSGIKIKLAVKKYGKENFKKEIIEECELSDLYIREKYWIEYYDAASSNEYYNIAEGGKGGDMLTNPTIFEKWDKNRPDIAKYAFMRKGKTYEEIYGDKAVEEKEKRKKSLLGVKHTSERNINNSLGHKGLIPWNKGLKKCDDERVRKNVEDRNKPKYFKTYELITPEKAIIIFNGRRELVNFLKNENKKLPWKSKIKIDELISTGFNKNYIINIKK